MENYYTTNDFNQEVLIKMDLITFLPALLALAIKDINRLEKAIKTTYCKEEAQTIFNILNSLK